MSYRYEGRPLSTLKHCMNFNYSYFGLHLQNEGVGLEHLKSPFQFEHLGASESPDRETFKETNVDQQEVS